jgi:uncharacterized C2H2 Zn-finger protein
MNDAPGPSGASAQRLGKQPPRFHFFLNPYPDVRFTRCPQCGETNRQRKVPLVIHVDPQQLISLNKTCRYCPRCDLLIAHQDEIEGFLAAFFGASNLEVMGNDYLVVGTQDRADWRRGVRSSLTTQEMLDSLHDFIEYVTFDVPRGWVRTT